MRNAEVDEAQAGLKIAGRNINNLRYHEALFHCTKPSGVPRGPSQLHSDPDFSEARCPQMSACLLTLNCRALILMGISVLMSDPC